MADACAAAGRPVRSVTLLAVSKYFGPDAVRSLHAAGQRAFGENYVQEGLAKIEALADLRPALEWHLIGPLQSNKTRPVAEAFDWVHTLDRAKVARRLAEQRPPALAPLQVCLQVNIDGGPTKSGLAPAEVGAVALEVAVLPRERLVLRGLMAIPDPCDDPAVQRRSFAALRVLRDDLQARLHAALGAAAPVLDTLSMGMSADLEAAIAEGATLVRVGTALFGARQPSVAPMPRDSG